MAQKRSRSGSGNRSSRGRTSGGGRASDRGGAARSGGGAGRRPTKAEWKISNPAFSVLFTFLFTKEGLRGSFDDARTARLSTLDYWSDVQGSNRNTPAKDLALRLDEYFTEDLLAEYQQADEGFAGAVQRMFQLLVGSTTTVGQLGVAVDDSYKFLGE